MVSQFEVITITDKPLISIIIPVYNTSRYLNRCLEAVTGQTYKKIEIILIDDGSIDNSGALCDEWKRKDERIIVIHKENGGLSSARNYGVEVSNGDYIGFIDSDDWIPNDYYEYLLKRSIAHDADIVSCSFQRVKDGETPHQIEGKEVIFKGNQILTEYLNSAIAGGDNDCSCCTKLYKRKYVVNHSFEEGIIFEDVIYNWEMLFEIETYVRLYSKKYYYYWNDTSTTVSRFSKKNLDLIYGAELIYNFSKKHNGPKELSKQYIVKCHFSILIRLLKCQEADISLLKNELEYLKKNKIMLIKSKLSLSRKIIFFLLIFGLGDVICFAKKFKQ